MPTGLTIVKRFPYRANLNEEFSNTYFFSGTPPSGAAAWDTFAGLVAAEERKVYSSAAKVVAFYGYEDDSEDRTAVWSKDMRTTGSLGGLFTGAASGVKCPGDAAAWVRWQTGRYTEKGKKIYLRKYFHDVYMEPSTADTLLGTQRVAMIAFGTKLTDGTLDGRHIVGRGHVDDVISSSAASLYVTTRTLKRRGKRPGS